MTLDEICKMTTNPEMLNTLHACREGHPLHNDKCWANAFYYAVQQPLHVFSGQVIDWLADKANDEAEAL